MAKAIMLLFVAGGVLYFLFYPFVKNKVNRKKTFRWFLILYGGALLFSTVGYYMSGAEEPASFKAGVELMKQNKKVRAAIGEFREVQYEENDLPAKSANPAILKFQLQGSKATMLIEGSIAKDSGGDWYFTEIKKDSLL